MKYNKILGKSPIGWLNRLVCQWLFFRIEMELADGPPGIAIGRDIIKLRVIGPIWPLTGWTTPYRYLWK